MVDTPDTEHYEAFGIAVDMIMAKYHRADAVVLTDRVASFVAGGATREENERRLGIICQALASMGGQLATALGELSPTAVEEYFDGLQAMTEAEPSRPAVS